MTSRNERGQAKGAAADGHRVRPGPHIICATAVYDLQAARIALGLSRSTLGRELRLGRLRAAKRAGKYLLLGEWLLQWIREGEVRRS
jgi:hypothetical protein